MTFSSEDISVRRTSELTGRRDFIHPSSHTLPPLRPNDLFGGALVRKRSVPKIQEPKGQRTAPANPHDTENAKAK